MAEFVKVAAELTRMCRHYEGFCKECPLGFVLSCRHWVFDNPKEAEEIIMKWAAENPFKTNGAKFREVFGYDFVQAVYADNWYNAEYKEPEKQEEEA